MKISVIGVGIYSLALTKELAKNNKNKIILWTESDKVYYEYKSKKNITSVINYPLPKNVIISKNLKKVCQDPNLIYIVTSSKYVNSITKKMKEFLNKNTYVCIASKGIESSDYLFNIVSKNLNTNNIGVISGPTFAIDILNNNPVALTLATKNSKLRDLVINTLSTDTLKINISKDLIGVSICGVYKNIIAISTGIISGLKYSDSTKIMLINDSLIELKDIIYNLGGNKSTILAYSGIGDLILTSLSDKSRNYNYGYLLSKSKTKAKNFLKDNTVEGYDNLLIMYNLLNKKHIKANLLNTIYDIVYNNYNPNILIDYLMKKNG